MRSSLKHNLKQNFSGGLVAVGVALCGAAQAQTVGYFTDFTPGDTAPAAAIAANGFTPVAISDITTFDFNAVKIAVIDTVSGGLSLDLQSRESDLAKFVQNGGSLIINDASVTDNGLLPGGAGITLNPFGAFDSNGSDVRVAANSLLTSGPFGTLTGNDLSGGNESLNGYADASSLPAGAKSLLVAGGGAGQSAAFTYNFGLGKVLYTTVPLDYYLTSPFAADPPKTNFVNIFAPNEIALASVPEPGALTLLAVCGVAGLGLRSRCRKRVI